MPSCIKVKHTGSGYLHDENDDEPYWVDGVKYCGKCHVAIDANGVCEEGSRTPPAEQGRCDWCKDATGSSVKIRRRVGLPFCAGCGKRLEPPAQEE